MSKKDEALKLALEYLKLQKTYGPAMAYGNTTIDEAIDAIKKVLVADFVSDFVEQPAPVQQEPVAWVPYLSDRADGVSGHYAIARWNPRGYREVWNLRRHAWGAYSDDVLSLEEADTLLRLIEIPTRKVETPQPAQRKPIDLSSAIQYADARWSGVDVPIEWCRHFADALAEQPAQRNQLIAQEIREWWASENGLEDCKMCKLDDFEKVVRAVEAKHNIKDQP